MPVQMRMACVSGSSDLISGTPFGAEVHGVSDDYFIHLSPVDDHYEFTLSHFRSGRKIAERFTGVDFGTLVKDANNVFPGEAGLIVMAKYVLSEMEKRLDQEDYLIAMQCVPIINP